MIRRVTAVAAVSIVLAGGLAGCGWGSPADPASRGSRSSAAKAPDADFPARDALVSVVCTPSSSGGGTVQVDGWDPKSWKHLARVQFPLPAATAIRFEDASDGSGLTTLCDLEPDDPDEVSAVDVAAIRSLFDQDFTKIAVTTLDRETQATHVGYVDRTGKFTDLTGDEGFGNTPHEHTASLSRDGQTLWFLRTNKTGTSLVSRSLSGDHRPVERLRTDGDNEQHVITAGKAPGVVVLARSAALSPDGKHLIADGRFLDVPADASVIDADKTGEPHRRACEEEPLLWATNETVLCGSTTGSSPITTAGTAPKSTPGPSLLPDNDHNNQPMVVAPDGRSFVFLSINGSLSHYYVSATTPGSTPRMADETGEFATLGKQAFIIDWR
ncbi:hypothetical protein ACFYNX_10620 [Streptomyces sp. NPDC007872]|uniref:hypothetical protein n=1 Tax=Streptomyces sp. NPDC007872 TaxID=3364782 RepID=UPI003696C2D4